MRIKSITELQAFIVDEKKIARAMALWELSQPIANTPAEKYLVDVRKIPAAVARSLSFKHLRGPLGIKALDENKPYRDYVVTPVHNLDNKLIGVHLIQVGADGQKAQGPSRQFYCKTYIGASNPPRSGQAALINPGVFRDTVYLAEGVETAASVAVIDEVREQHAILASLGVDALPTVLGYVKTHYPPGARVVFLKDHDKDNSAANQAFCEAQKLFSDAGYEVVVKEPLLEGTDWNDVLQHEGPQGVGHYFHDLVSEIGPESETDNVSSESTQEKRSHRVPPALIRYFDSIYNELLGLEYFAEQKALFLKMIHALTELGKRVSQCYEALAHDEEFRSTILELKDIRAALKIMDKAWIHLTGRRLEGCPTSLQLFKTNLKMYEAINTKRKKLLNEEIEIFSVSDHDEAAVYRAYYVTLELLLAHLTALSEQDKELFKNRTFSSNRLVAISKEILVLKKCLQEMPQETGAIGMLQEQIQCLEAEKKFFRGEVAKLNNQLKLLPNHTGFTGEYARYSRHFVDFVNHKLRQCEFSYSRIRQLLTKEKEAIRSCLQKDYAKLGDKALASCRKHLESELALLDRTIQNLKKGTGLQIEQLENSLPRSSERFYHYHQALRELEDLPLQARRLQEWLNNLALFKMAGPLIYSYPETESNAAFVDTFLDYDSDEEETIDSLTSAVLETAGGHEDLDGDNEQFGPLKRTACRLFGIDPHDISEDLLLTIADFSEKLSVSLYKSFTLVDPETKSRQEFDGIALRGHCLTIIERKANDGTGDGVLQRNFCQHKIMAKMQFLQKGIISKIMHHPTPQNWLLLDVPASESWYSKQFTADIKERLVQAAKAKLLDAFKAITLEFTLNRSQAFVRENYQGLFFNRQHGLCDVHIRLSTQQKGNEKIAHERIEKLSGFRSASRAG